MNLSELKAWLEGAGFKCAADPLRNQHNDCEWYAWRRSTLPARECECNERTSMQLVIHPYSSVHGGSRHESVTAEVRGAYAAHWWTLQAYSLSADELAANLSEIEGSLVRAWEALAPRPERSAGSPDKSAAASGNGAEG